MFVMILLCACLACAGYGYRRHYVVRRVVYAPPTATTVISTAGNAVFRDMKNVVVYKREILF